MLIELFIFFQVVVIGMFIAAFFTKQEILWVISLVLTGILMATSYNIETYVYEFNQTIGAYMPVIVSHSYPYLMGINMIFFSLGVLLALFDIFEKYGLKFAGTLKNITGRLKKP